MKDPAFLFYPNDWIGGTMGMTFEEKGAYMELLMLQFNRGHMTSHMIGQTVGQLWDKIKDKFKIDENGLFYNERLEIEKENRKTFTESRRNNLLGTNQHSKKLGHKVGRMGGHTTIRMENENEDTNNRKNIFYNKISKYLDRYDKSLLRDFYDYWTESNEDGKKMRFEMEKVFNVSRRLGTWKKNEAKFGFKKEKEPEPKLLKPDFFIEADGRKYKLINNKKQYVS